MPSRKCQISGDLKSCLGAIQHWYPKGLRRCPFCQSIWALKKAKRNNKYVAVGLEPKVIPRSQVPQQYQRFAADTWLVLIRQLTLLNRNEALEVNLRGANFRHQQIAKHTARLNVRVGYLVHGGNLYLWKL